MEQVEHGTFEVTQLLTDVKESEWQLRSLFI